MFYITILPAGMRITLASSDVPQQTHHPSGQPGQDRNVKPLTRHDASEAGSHV